MNLLYFSLIYIFVNLYVRSVQAGKATPVPKTVDTMVNRESLDYESTENFCRNEAELKYGDSNKNGRNQCCFLLAEIECLKPHVEKVCIQHKLFHKLLKNDFERKINFKILQCGSYQFDCPEESYSIWMLMITIFTGSITIASFCIICFIYIRS